MFTIKQKSNSVLAVFNSAIYRAIERREGQVFLENTFFSLLPQTFLLHMHKKKETYLSVCIYI